jgi:UDP-2-acetamido-2-deoxy-ribo-hexuluronate aminotransferase
MKFFDLISQRLSMQQEIDHAIEKVLSHGQFILGPEVFELEDLLSDYTGAKYCITCANGTDALQIALMAVGVGPGDEVITPAFSYIATAEATAVLGAKPVFVDVDKITFNMDPSQIEEKITENTKAIIPVSLYGQVAEFGEINRIAKKHNIFVIEDAAQSFGGEYNGIKSCNLSDLACTSFFPTKPLGCYGDGGAVFTSDEHLAKQIRLIARHGQSRKYFHERIGINSRLDTIQASILKAKLSYLDHEIQQRDRISDFYTNNLRKYPSISVPKIRPGVKSAWAQYTIRIDNRDEIKETLSSQKIPTVVHYPLPLHKQPALLDPSCNMINSEELSQEVLSLPFHLYLSEDEKNTLIDAIVDCIK